MADTNSPAVRRGGVLIRLSIVAVTLVVAAVAVWLVQVAVAPRPSPASAEIPSLEIPAALVEPNSVAPVQVGPGPAAPEPQAGQNGTDPLRAWAERLAGPTQIPVRALMAYGNAELAVRAMSPGCRLSWATLAGIGRIESDHGRYGGATLGADGRPSTPIIGVPLDGSAGVKAISDTDGGQFDGDAAVDRAVGPMQFIPSTWKRWGADANLDGRGDPQQIDDAALAAGRYLCANGRDLGTPTGWWQGVFSYNNSVPYGQKVFGLADGYARTSAAAR
ncbi:Membrane-bound lytic murein transglycosylase B [Actinokineospora iranica]|uniref:Membrane-bound lytic murein transglycosylase B n=1 Tax=Actinokineospora iranica TaxID=1271860 RepID=A0A1G6K982_9PSEU|nr:lytic murein transglycosylase [Actinokineospora iranica]SDC27497.1 Membrane-bound lytic murein transglycosylase B [Actinokineospora iranica]